MPSAERSRAPPSVRSPPSARRASRVRRSFRPSCFPSRRAPALRMPPSTMDSIRHRADTRLVDAHATCNQHGERISMKRATAAENGTRAAAITGATSPEQAAAATGNGTGAATVTGRIHMEQMAEAENGEGSAAASARRDAAIRPDAPASNGNPTRRGADATRRIKELGAQIEDYVIEQRRYLPPASRAQPAGVPHHRGHRARARRPGHPLHPPARDRPRRHHPRRRARCL